MFADRQTLFKLNFCKEMIILGYQRGCYLNKSTTGFLPCGTVIGSGVILGCRGLSQALKCV